MKVEKLSRTYVSTRYILYQSMLHLYQSVHNLVNNDDQFEAGSGVVHAKYPIEDATRRSGIKEGHGSTENTPHHAQKILLGRPETNELDQQRTYDDKEGPSKCKPRVH